MEWHLVDKAYEKMVDLIESGVEFPDAHSSVAIEFDLSQKESDRVMEIYDQEQCS